LLSRRQTRQHRPVHLHSALHLVSVCAHIYASTGGVSAACELAHIAQSLGLPPSLQRVYRHRSFQTVSRPCGHATENWGTSAVLPIRDARRYSLAHASRLASLPCALCRRSAGYAGTRQATRTPGQRLRSTAAGATRRRLTRRSTRPSATISAISTTACAGGSPSLLLIRIACHLHWERAAHALQLRSFSTQCSAIASAISTCMVLRPPLLCPATQLHWEMLHPCFVIVCPSDRAQRNNKRCQHHCLRW